MSNVVEVPAQTAAELQAKSMDAEFRIPDADGNSRHYTVRCHGTIEGGPIVLALVGHGVVPLLRLLGAAFESDISLDQMATAWKSAIASDGEDEEAEDAADAKVDEAAKDLFAGIDLGALGTDLREVLLSSEVADLPARILRHTNREGVPLFKGDGTPNTFDQAYRKNWIEYGHAVWKVVEANGFLPLPASLTA